MFNTCQHQPLPLMHGPPLELHTDPNVKPHAIYTPASVPVHWKEKVEQDIRRDVALGVLEEVPEKTPVTWCHRMVVCRKHNGDPRRTVDLQKLNEASVSPHRATSSAGYDSSSQHEENDLGRLEWLPFCGNKGGGSPQNDIHH